jgi:hypothetical protein
LSGITYFGLDVHKEAIVVTAAEAECGHGLFWDRSSMCLFAERLDHHKIRLPPIVDCTLTLTPGRIGYRRDRLASQDSTAATHAGLTNRLS